MSNRWLRTISTAALVETIMIALRILGWPKLLVGTLILTTFMVWKIRMIPSDMKQQIAHHLYKGIFSKHNQIARNSNISNRWLRTISTAALVGTMVIVQRILVWPGLLVGALILATLIVWIVWMTEEVNQQVVLHLYKEIFSKHRQKASTASNDDSALGLRIDVSSPITQILAPSSQVGPEAVEFPVTGHSIIVKMVCLGKIDLTILGFRAEVIRRTPLKFDSVMRSASPTPLEIPHFEILLDKHPPIIRPALKADGLPARPTPQLPFTLHPYEYRSFFLAPVTRSQDLTEWLLYIIWEFEGKLLETPYNTFRVTGDTGFWTIFPNGKVAQTPPSHGHWDTQYN